MGYERYPRNTNDRFGQQGQTRDYGSDRDYGSSGQRYSERQDRDDYGQREYGHAGYTQREQQSRGYVQQTGGQQSYGQARYAQGDEYHGSYASDGRRFEDIGDRRDWDDDARRQPSGRLSPQGRGDYGRQPQGYDYEDRGFIARAGDEVRSWFGDEDAEKRREYDTRYDERSYGGRDDRDDHYGNWRRTQIGALDRDYDEYRREHRSKFENEFSSWRSNRQTQRDALGKVEEHMDVVGSDGTHVGTVDKVRGDRILLTKSDPDAGGQHHSIPSSWLQTVDDKVTLSKSADEAKRQWRDEERSQAIFGDNDAKPQERAKRDDTNQSRDSQGRMLNRSFSGTY